MNVKLKIESIVNTYLKKYPLEADDFLRQVSKNRMKQDNKFGLATATKDTSNMRALFEIPETLYGMIKIGLDEHELEWFYSLRGSRWFAKKFKSTSLAQSI